MNDPKQPPDAPTHEEHWNTTDPENQPPRDLTLNLHQMVTEELTRQGSGATADTVFAALTKRGLEVTREEVAEVCEIGK